MTTSRGELTFVNGESYLVVRRTRDEHLVDMVKWPGRPRRRPTTPNEMNQAIDAYLRWDKRERVNED
jgi:hypothetical protein